MYNGSPKPLNKPAQEGLFDIDDSVTVALLSDKVDFTTFAVAGITDPVTSDITSDITGEITT